MTRLVDGRTIAVTMATATAAAAAVLRSGGITPALAVLVPTDDAGAAWYVRSIQRTAARTGIACQVHRMGGPRCALPSAAEIGDRLGNCPGIRRCTASSARPRCGLRRAGPGGRGHPRRPGCSRGEPGLAGRAGGRAAGRVAPATAAAVLQILRHERIPLSGRRAVVVGRSTVVGKPVALLLLAEHATVTVAHSRTVDLPGVCREADVLVVAAGRPKLVGADHVRPGAVVIDVGTTPIGDTEGGGLAGDVDAAAVTGIASVLTPVPGGVGPVTTAVLMQHTLAAAARTAGQD